MQYRCYCTGVVTQGVARQFYGEGIKPGTERNGTERNVKYAYGKYVSATTAVERVWSAGYFSPSDS